MQNKDIQNLLEKVNLLFSVLLKDGIENTTKIERELLKEQVQKLYTAIDAVAPKTSKEETIHNEDLEQLKETSIHAPENEIEEEPETITSESEAEVDKEPFIAFVDEENDVQSEKIDEVQDETKVKQEIFEEKKSFDIQAAFPDKEFSENEPKRKIKEIIDLNKSFILKAELFNGDIEAYNTFIQEMDTIQTEEASFEYLNNLAEQLGWDPESKVYELIIRVVEKRFIPII